MVSYPISWIVARDLGYSLKAIETVTYLNENIKAGDLVERLMDLDEHTMNAKLDRSWIEDFSMLHYKDSEIRRMKLELSETEIKKVKPSIDLSKCSIDESDFRKKLETETFKLLCERNCIRCFEREKSLLLLPCSHFVMCSTCYIPLETTFCPLCDEEIISTVTVYRS